MSESNLEVARRAHDIPIEQVSPDFDERVGQFLRLAKGVIGGGLAPKGMNKPESVAIAMQTGYELGFTPMQSLSAVTVINGRAGLMGNAAVGLLRSRGAFEEGTDVQRDYFGEEGTDAWGCRVTLHRRGAKEPVSDEFTVRDAKRARLWGKQGPWSEYPNRMLFWRALGFLMRDYFDDILKGLPTEYELRDMNALDGPRVEKEVRAASRSDEPKEDPLKAILGAQDADTTLRVQGERGGVSDAEILDQEADDEPLPDYDEMPPPGVLVTCVDCESNDEYPIGLTSQCSNGCGTTITVADDESVTQVPPPAEPDDEAAEQGDLSWEEG